MRISSFHTLIKTCYVALGSGGILGIGEKTILIPMRAMNWVANGDDKKGDLGHLVVNLTKDQVQNAPTVDNLDKVDFSATTWDQGLRAYWQKLGIPVQ